MIRHLAIIAALLISVAGQPNQAAHAQQPERQNAQPSTSYAEIPNERGSGTGHETKSDTNTPNWYATFERPDWWVVGIALLTAVVIGWQSYETRKAAEASVISGDIARISATAVMNAERAWLSVEIAQQPTPEDMTVSRKQPNWALGVPFTFRNKGRTVARITNSYIRVIFSDSVQPVTVPAVPILPQVPDYPRNGEHKTIVDAGSIWFPGDEFKYVVTISQNMFATADTNAFYTCNRLLCIYGFVAYQDAFANPPKFTRFCYIFQIRRMEVVLYDEKDGSLLFPPAFVIGGPTSYNEAT